MSLTIFFTIPNQKSVLNALQILRQDHIGTHFPNLLKSYFTEHSNSKKYIRIEGQTPSPGFMMQNISTLFIYNIFPIFTFHMLLTLAMCLLKYVRAINIWFLYLK